MVVPSDLSALHIIAVTALLLAWFSYSTVLDFVGRGTLNNQLIAVRRRWILNIGEREYSPFDAIMLGHIAHSVAFFASATLIVLAALISVFIYLENIHAAMLRLHFVNNSSIELFAYEFALFVFIVTLCFFSFIYALRKLIYAVALIGALPRAARIPQAHDELVESITIVLTGALRTFNFGIRGFYYAVAALMLFISPWACILATALIAAVLVRSQFNTNTARAVGRYVERIEAAAAPDQRQQSPR